MFQIKLILKNKFLSLKSRRQSEKTAKLAGKTSVVGTITAYLLKFTILVFMGFLILFPFYFMVSFSLMTQFESEDVTTTHLAPKVAQWSNYTKAFADGYWKAVLVTAILTSVSIALKIVITMMVGYAFSLPKWRGKKALWVFMLSLMALPEIALMGGQYQIMVQFGWQKGMMVMAALVVPFIASVFSGIMFRNAFLAIPERTKEAALIDGVYGMKYFWKVAVPMITPTIWTVGILTAFAAWNPYMWPAFLLPSSNTGFDVISTWVFKTGNVEMGDTKMLIRPVRMAGAVLAVLPMFIAYFAMRGRIMKAISRQGSAIKG